MMNNTGIVTVGKVVDRGIVEDASCCFPEKGYIAVCDGAGGCGIFADEWAKYLIERIPEQPIDSYEMICSWLDGIWEPFFLQKEQEVGSMNSFVQNKFYDEGSYATLAAIWRTASDRVSWCTFGDSACFAYDKKEDRLTLLSHPSIQAFETNPHLLNWKNIPSEKGFKAGTYIAENDTVFFVTSDALACYITMANALIKNEPIHVESGALVMLKRKIDVGATGSIFKGILDYLFFFAGDKSVFGEYMKELYDAGEIANDDYSLAWITLTK